ncbi:phytochelatin synthase family protein, partial [Brasilonema sp. UFV-L1]|uniref:phytochelatin synthase family protein n=1 Tax=Brasilonema sp. UFV-L1 TaxID=2234130 RepID=UPI002006EEE7
MTLAETYDTSVKYIETKNLPISVTVEHFDKADMTLDAFVAEIERAVNDENDIHILNFNVDIAHGIKLGGGHFSLLADYEPDTQLLTIADTNPKRYTRFWKCPAERMYLASIDRARNCNLIS